MLFKRKTAVRSRRNLLGKPVRGMLQMQDVAGRSREDILDLLDMGYLLPVGGAATTPQNTVAEGPIYFPRAIVVTSDQTVNQGDLCWWDPVNYTLKALTAATQVAVSSTGGFCGAAQGSSNPNVYPDPPGGVPSEHLPGIVVQRGGTVWLNATTADSAYVPFQPVTVGADAQTVTRGGETAANRVGYVIVAPPTTTRGTPGATPAPETDGSSRVRVWLEPKFPDTALL